MALIIADRVKESTVTSGSGRITLSGATFGGFQTFADAISDGNSTYYCIQNFDRFEIGLGTYRASDNSLSRDSVFESSNSDSLINLQGASVVFSVVPADKLVYKDEDDAVVFPTPFTFKRSDTGDYWQAYSIDQTNRVTSFYLQEGSDPSWTIGLKTSDSDIIKPFYGYISAKDGFVELKGNTASVISIGDGASEGLQVDHQFQTIIDLRKNGGSIHVQNLDLNTDETTTIKNTTLSSNVLDIEGAIGHAADLQTWSVSTDELASINQYGDFETIGNIISPSGRFHAIRFADTTVQTTAALPFASGALIDQNTQNIITNSGYFQTYIDSLDHSATAVSGWARGYIDQTSGNLQFEISQVSSDLSSTSGYFESRVDSADSEILANSGYFESKISDSNSSLATTSGYFESRVDSADSEILANSGYFESRVDSADSEILANSGYFESRVDSADSEILANSGYFESRVDSADSEILANSGYFESRVDSADSEILANSGYFESKISDSNSSLATTSGYFESRVDSADSEILANSGYFESRANNTDDNLNTVSGLLTPSGESFDFTSNILTYNNSYGGSFTADLSSLSTFDTSGVSLGYSNGILTYTNNAGGSFGVDISAISGDVYAMIVDGAPTTLDTLNEIAAALNDDENIANTLTNLITTSSGNLQAQITDNDSDISQLNTDINTVSGLLETASDRFTSDITVSLGGGKTFGRYENGDVIPSSGLKPSQVISLAVTEPIAPTASLTSSSAVDFNQVNVSTTLSFSHTINSLGATVTSASLEFRRGNSGSWTVLSTSTSASSSYNHTFPDTAFNTAVLNYRYTVTDTAGATTTVTKDIYPDTYSAPSISFSIAAVSTTSPETNSSRERGNVNSNISGSINRNETYVNLISYTLQYSVNGGAWTDIGSAVSIGPGNSTISTTNHNPTASNTATSIRYRVKVVDDYTTSYSSISTVSFGYLIFYGPSSSAPTTSANARALPSRLFTTGNNVFTLNTGSTEVNFTVAIPSTESISEVIDLDALNANITSQYVNNAFNVDDAGGTAVSYNVYTMTQATAYSSNHRHQVTKG
jgi:hypothetical protein